MTSINDYFKNTGVGSGSDRLKIEADGTIHRTGAATVWDDLATSLIGKRLNSTSGKVSYNYAENTVTFNSGGSIAVANDIVNFNLQMPHAAIEDGVLKLHIHWQQPNATDREITVKHRIQSHGSAKQTTWTTTVVALDSDSAVFTYTSGTLNQITPLATIDLTGASISAIVEFQIARTDIETGDIEVTSIDCHYERDTDGSRSEYSK